MRQHAVRFTILAGLGLLGACTEPTTPDPTPAPITTAATVELRTDDALVFTGQRAPLRALVARVLDAGGRPITDYKLAAELPTGWQLVNDTVIAPAAERAGRLKVTATYTAPAGSLAPLLSASAAAATDTAIVTSAVDLKSRRWRVTWSCSNVGFAGGFMTDENVFIDSMRVEAANVDSVRYASDSAFIPQFGGVAQFWVRGDRMIRWLRNATVDTVPYRTNSHTIWRQAPDTLQLGPPTEPPAQRHALSATPGVINTLLRYEGGTFCSQEWRHYRSPVVMQEY